MTRRCAISDLLNDIHNLRKLFPIKVDRGLLLHAQAHTLLSALHTSGDVLRHENRLYLKPEEVADIVLKALPDTQEEAQASCPPR